MTPLDGGWWYHILAEPPKLRPLQVPPLNLQECLELEMAPLLKFCIDLNPISGEGKAGAPLFCGHSCIVAPASLEVRPLSPPLPFPRGLQ